MSTITIYKLTDWDILAAFSTHEVKFDPVIDVDYVLAKLSAGQATVVHGLKFKLTITTNQFRVYDLR